MPMSGGEYLAPTWVNGAAPAIDADELQAICDTVQGSQVRSAVCTLSSSGWTGGSQTVSVAGVSSSCVVVPSPADYAGWSAAGEAKIACTGAGEGTLTFSCEEAPSVDIDYNVLILGV